MAFDAVIDVGTNSALLLVAERVDNRWSARLQKEEICRLGKGWEPGMPISADALVRLEESLLRLRASLALVGGRLRAVGMTEAVRHASNPGAAIDVVERVLGIEPRILSGEEEGRLVRLAVAEIYPEATKLVVLDLGGGSMEIDNGKKVFSMPLGAVRLFEQFREKTREAVLKHIKLVFREAGLKRPTYNGCHLVVVGGTATTLVALEKGMAVYDGSQIEGHKLEMSLIDHWLERLDRLSPELRARLPGLSPGRADILPWGLVALRFAMEFLQPEVTVVSDAGLRWGLLLDATKTK